MHAATSKVENSAQGSSCQLKLVHGPNLELKTIPKQLLGSLPLDIALPMRPVVLTCWYLFGRSCRRRVEFRNELESEFSTCRRRWTSSGKFDKSERVRGCLHNTTLSSQPIKGTNKLEGLFPARIPSLV